ncbi:MAG: hypothetical protein WBW32_10120, partial [Luteibacter sp.]
LLHETCAGPCRSALARDGHAANIQETIKSGMRSARRNAACRNGAFATPALIWRMLSPGD